MSEVKTNLRWPGGKSRMMKILDKYLPDAVDRYLETFTGGGSVLLYMIQKYHPTTVYANDIDSNLINYYKTVRDNPQQLMEDCTSIKQQYNSEEFKEVFKLQDRSTAAGFFTLNKTSFSGIGSNYSIQAYDRNFSTNAIRKIGDVSEVIQNTKFINSNFKDLDTVIPESIKDFFIYLDPPYYGNRKIGLYGKKGNLHKNFDHDGLLQWVNQHRDNNLIMMSYDDSPYVREMYKDYFIYDFDFIYTMTNVGGNTCKTGKEIVITNYEVSFDSGDSDGSDSGEQPMFTLF